jgi:hypothetical protein
VRGLGCYATKGAGPFPEGDGDCGMFWAGSRCLSLYVEKV